MRLQTSPLIAHILLLIVNLIYGANFAIAKAIMPRYIEPFGFILYRVSVSLILYALIYFIWIREKINRQDYLRIALCGFFGIALNQMLFFKGISLTSSVHGALLMILTPMFTFLFSHIISKESILSIKILGLVLGTVGASMLILQSVHATTEASLLGDICVVFNAISYAIYLIIVKPLMKKYNPITVIYLCFLTGWAWVAIFGYSEASAVDFSTIPSAYYWNFGYVILGATFIVYLFNIVAMKSVSPTTVSSYIYVQPLFAILISQCITGESLSISTIIGGICIIFGLLLVNRKTT